MRENDFNCSPNRDESCQLDFSYSKIIWDYAFDKQGAESGQNLY